MKLMGSERLTPVPTASRRSGQGSAAAVDRPTFSLPLNVPVEWEALAGPPTDALLERLERTNDAVVATLLKCADLGTRPIQDETLAEALEPLRVKLDMAVEMLARLSYRELVLPDPRQIELGLDRLRWWQPAPLAPDRWLLNKIYFHDVFREPVVLAGRIAACMVQPGGTNKIEVDLAAMTESVSESFARLIFLEHRRQLARQAARRPMEARSR